MPNLTSCWRTAADVADLHLLLVLVAMHIADEQSLMPLLAIEHVWKTEVNGAVTHLGFGPPQQRTTAATERLRKPSS